MGVRVYGCTGEWVYGCMGVRVNGCMGVRVNGCMVVWVYESSQRVFVAPDPHLNANTNSTTHKSARLPSAEPEPNPTLTL